MKYNRSEIFKNAWVLKRACEKTFGECLKTIWEKTKETVAKAKTVVEKHIQIEGIAKWFLRKMDTIHFMALQSGVEIDDIILERETEKAIEISTEWNYGRKKIWLPKSVVKFTFA